MRWVLQKCTKVYTALMKELEMDPYVCSPSLCGTQADLPQLPPLRSEWSASPSSLPTQRTDAPSTAPELVKLARKYYFQRVGELHELMELEQIKFRYAHSPPPPLARPLTKETGSPTLKSTRSKPANGTTR